MPFGVTPCCIFNFNKELVGDQLVLLNDFLTTTGDGSNITFIKAESDLVCGAVINDT